MSNPGSVTAISPFMQLPKELRLMIYEYVIVIGSTEYLELQCLNGKYDLYIRPMNSEGASLNFYVYNSSLFFVCKSIHQECLELFYSRNTFHVAPLQSQGWETHWLSYADIQHLILRLENDEGNVQRAVQDIQHVFHLENDEGRIQRAVQFVVRMLAHHNLKSCSLILSAQEFDFDLSINTSNTSPGLLAYLQAVSSGMGYRCSQSMLKRLLILKQCSQRLSVIESRRLVVFTSSHPRATALLVEATTRHEADKYSESLHTAFGGELWINHILYRRDGTQPSKLPFPFGCSRFDRNTTWEIFESERMSQIRLGRLLVAFGEDMIGGLEEEHLDRFEGADIALSQTPLSNVWSQRQIRAVLRQARESFDSINSRLKDPDLTEGLLKQRFQDWEVAFDAIMARLPNPETFPVNVCWD